MVEVAARYAQQLGDLGASGKWFDVQFGLLLIRVVSLFGRVD
jgi:hypothetical protein